MTFLIQVLTVHDFSQQYSGRVAGSILAQYTFVFHQKNLCTTPQLKIILCQSFDHYQRRWIRWYTKFSRFMFPSPGGDRSSGRFGDLPGSVLVGGGRCGDVPGPATVLYYLTAPVGGDLGGPVAVGLVTVVAEEGCSEGAGAQLQHRCLGDVVDSGRCVDGPSAHRLPDNDLAHRRAWGAVLGPSAELLTLLTAFLAAAW